MKRFLALAALACAAPRPALALDPDIPYASFTLDNGLRVIVHEDHKAPIVAVNVWYHVGSQGRAAGPDRLRAPVRAPDVQRLGEPQRRLLPAVRAGRRHRHERHHLVRSHELLRERADHARSTWRCGWNPTAWATCSARSTRRSSTSSAASCRTRSARARTSPTASVDELIIASTYPAGHPYSLGHDRLDGGPERRLARRREGLVPARTTAPRTRRSCSPATSTAATAQGEGREVLRRHPARPADRSASERGSRS